MTALRITRAIRFGEIRGSLARRCDLIRPSLDARMRWSAKSIRGHLERFGPAAAFSETQPLNVIVPSSEERLQVKGVRCSFRKDLEPKSFVDLGEGIAMSSPELMFLELARVMDPIAHLLLGMELCGCFSRSSHDPRSGPVRYGIAPATTAEHLRRYAASSSLRGRTRALKSIDLICDNSWSPMEAIVAALLVLPCEQLGYDLWPIELNRREKIPDELVPLTTASSRVPDILLAGTKLGLNYDGEDHFGLGGIVRAAMDLALEPSAARTTELDRTLDAARTRIVADKRRDRELEALGYTVFSVTKEDLIEAGGLDRVIGLLLAVRGDRDARFTRAALASRDLSRARQDLIWSLIPGRRAREARARLEQRKSRPALADEAFLVEYRLETGEAHVVALDIV